MSINNSSKTRFAVLNILLSYAGTVSFAYFFTLTGDKSSIAGPFRTSSTSWCLFSFAIQFLLTGFFLKTLSERKIRRFIICLIFGIISTFLYMSAYLMTANGDIANTGLEWLKFLGGVLYLSPSACGIFSIILGNEKFLNGVRKMQNTMFSVTFQPDSEHFNFAKMALIYTAVFVLFFLPAYMAFYPGIFNYDMGNQYDEVVDGDISSWHTLAHMGMLVAGLKIGNAAKLNLGFGIITFLQVIMVAFAFGSVIALLGELGIKKKFRIIFSIILSLIPYNAILTISWTKDIMFAAFFTLYIVWLIRIYEKVRGGEKPRPTQWILFAIFTGGTLAFRNNALFALLAAFPFMVIYFRKQWKKFVLVSIASLLMFEGSNKILAHALDATVWTSRVEACSMMLQQLGRVYVNEEDGAETISDVFEYIYEDNFSNYSVMSTDGIKAGVNNDYFSNNFLSFLKTWFKTGLKYPGDYWEAFVGVNQGNWFIDDVFTPLIYGSLVLFDNGAYLLEENVVPLHNFPLIESYYHFWFDNNNYQNIPVIALVFKNGTWFTMYFVAFAYALDRKKWKNLAGFIPAAMYFATLLLAPVSLLRYFYCLIVAAPAVIGYILRPDAGVLPKNK